MSWLYTIVFAGLLLSSGNETAPSAHKKQVAPQISNTVVQADEIEKFEQTYPLNANGRVSVSNVNGSITIEAWDRNEVYLSVTKIADSKETLALMDVKIDARPDHFRVESDHKNWNLLKDSSDRRRKLEVEYLLRVPRTAALNQIETVNGSVSVSNFTNITRVSAVNGAVSALNIRGNAKLSTVNGEVKAEFAQLDPGSSVSLDTVNGVVNLTLPSDVNAEVKADSLNGNIGNDFGLPVRKGKYIGRNLHGQIGAGGVQVKLSSVNGSLSIGRKKDGLSAPPVTNLLKPGDPDVDIEDVSIISEVENADREISRAVRASQRATAKETKVTERQTIKLKDLEKTKVDKLKDVKVVVVPDEIEKAVSNTVRLKPGAVTRIADAIWTRGERTIQKRANSFDVKPPAQVTVEAKGCQVRIRGWDQPTVKYVLTESKTRLGGPLSLSENASANAVNLKVNRAARSPQFVFMEERDEARIDVLVPRRSDVKVTTDLEVRIDGVSGKIDLSTESAPVSIRDSEGNLKLETGDGLIRVLGFQGELDLKTVDAEVYLEGDFEKIASTASDSDITLTMPDGKNASISTNIALESEGMSLTRENGRTWKVGAGGPRYIFDFTDGRLVVRNSSIVETN